MSLMNSGFEESLWCTLLKFRIVFLIGLCYRCPSSTSENDNLLLSLLDTVSMQVNVSHVMIMGDFNFPDIDFHW